MRGTGQHLACVLPLWKRFQQSLGRTMANSNRIVRKASRLYKERHCFIFSITDRENRQMSVTSVGVSGVYVKRFPVKALAGRGRKRALWVEYVRIILFMDF